MSSPKRRIETDVSGKTRDSVYERDNGRLIRCFGHEYR